MSWIPQKRKFCKMNQSDCRNHKFPGLHDFMLDAIRGISSLNKFKCRGIQDTLNIKEKFCPGFHNFPQFSCPGFHENSKIACLCTVMLSKGNVQETNGFFLGYGFFGTTHQFFSSCLYCFFSCQFLY